MRNYTLFDLDGTLTDPMAGITNSVAYALESYGIHVEDKNALTVFIGPPLMESFQKYYGFSGEQAREAMWKYREYFEKAGMFENKVIPGIPETLKALKEKGGILITATSKPEIYAKRIMDKFGLSQYFTDICGADMAETRVRKGDVIRYAMEKNQIGSPKEAIMVGDREHDVCGARACGMECAGVLFGYGSRQELLEAGAVRILENPRELKDYLLEVE